MGVGRVEEGEEILVRLDTYQDRGLLPLEGELGTGKAMHTCHPRCRPIHAKEV